MYPRLERMLRPLRVVFSDDRPSGKPEDRIMKAAAGSAPRLHLGCGEVHLEGYVNIDFPSSEHNVMRVTPDVNCDILKLDFANGTIAEVRLHHVFEHFRRVTALACLVKWHAWLKIGGVLWIETPDFEASATDFTQATKLSDKLKALRHLEGDQAASWAFHIGQWFPERFQTSLAELGYGEIIIDRQRSDHSPPLRNVTVRARKTRYRDIEAQFSSSCDLLRDFLVDEAEEPTWRIWRSQLAQELGLSVEG